MLKFIIDFVEWHPFPIPVSAPLRNRLRDQLFDRLVCIALTALVAVELAIFCVLLQITSNLLEMIISVTFFGIALILIFTDVLYPKLNGYVERRYPYRTGATK